MKLSALRPLSVIPAVACAACFASSAQAEISPFEVTHPVDDGGLGPGYGRRDLQFHLDLGFYFGSDAGAGEASDGSVITEDRLALSPQLRIMQPFGFNEVEFSWGFVWLDVDSDLGSTSTFQLGNAYVAHYWVWRSLARQIRLGLGVGAPTAILRDERIEQTIADHNALAVAAGMRGWRDYWLWAPEGLSGIGHFDTYFRYPFGLVWGGQISAGDIYGLDDTAVTEALGLDGHVLLVQVDLEVAYDTRYLRSGLRASYVTLPLRDDFSRDENDQISLEAAFRIRLEKVDLVVRFDVPVDEPFGFAFDDGKVWGAHIGLSTPTELRLPEE
ncbi:MAG: hypothetical protein H6705_20525 [Myxococcales bacterium]|nr:hypothetical protein [Myxococcales bacterium]